MHPLLWCGYRGTLVAIGDICRNVHVGWRPRAAKRIGYSGITHGLPPHLTNPSRWSSSRKLMADVEHHLAGRTAAVDQLERLRGLLEREARADDRADEPTLDQAADRIADLP